MSSYVVTAVEALVFVAALGGGALWAVRRTLVERGASRLRTRPRVRGGRWTRHVGRATPRRHEVPLHPARS